jgi:hypothetical protein
MPGQQVFHELWDERVLRRVREPRDEHVLENAERLVRPTA